MVYLVEISKTENRDTLSLIKIEGFSFLKKGETLKKI
jgi:hypothetical protein